MERGRMLFWAFVAAILIVAASSSSAADRLNREGRGEIFATGLFLSGETSNDTFSSITFDDTFLGGLGVGINLNDYLNINLGVFYGSPDITVAYLGAERAPDTDLYGGNINLDIYLFRGHFTPMITGGAGWVRFDGDYDGYDFTETDLAYNVGGGFRWDVSGRLLLKATYTSTWIELEDFDAIRFNGANVVIGYVF